MDIHYTNGNISKAVFHLVTGDEPMPRRAWDAYLIASHGSSRDGIEPEFDELDRIFQKIKSDEVESKVSLEDARRAARILLKMYDSLQQQPEK